MIGFLVFYAIVGALCVLLAVRGRGKLEAYETRRRHAILGWVAAVSVALFGVGTVTLPALAVAGTIEPLPPWWWKASLGLPGIAITAALGRVVGCEGKAKALWSWSGVMFGVVFATLASSASRLPETRGFVFKIEQEIVRFGALLAGVLFLLVVLSAGLPIMLDALERRGYTWFVGARHVRATKSGFLTVISVLSMAGVAVSSCALCSVTSIMGGFGADLKGKILNNYGHVVVDVTRPGGFDGWQEKLDATRGALGPHQGAATPVVAGDAMGSSNTNTAGTLVRGIEPESIGSVIQLKKNIEVGKFEYLTSPEKLIQLPADEIIGLGPRGEPYYRGPDFSNMDPDAPADVEAFLRPRRTVYPGIILGKELAKSLHVLVGHEVTLLSPVGDLGPMGVMPRSRKFRVAGIFYSGMYEYDASHAYILIDEAQDFFDLGDRITNIDIHIPDAEKVSDVTPVVAQAMQPWMNELQLEEDGSVPIGPDGRPAPGPLRVRDWKEMNKNLFSALKLERIATFIILSIAIVVGSFCIVCTLLLMVTEKGKEIAVLKALGSSDRAIMGIFVIEGVIIGGIGTIFGVATAFAAMTGLKWFGVRLDPEIYYIDRLPVNVDGEDYLLVAAAALIICTVATLYPARAASRLNPVDGLRYE